MKRKSVELENTLNKVTDGIMREEIDRSVIDGAADRVWARLATEIKAETSASPAMESTAVDEIRGCSDFQSLIPAYLKGELSGARALLLEDHTQECIPCRRGLKAARTGEVVKAEPRNSRVAELKRPVMTVTPVWRWAIAATLVLGLGLGFFAFFQRFFGSGNGRATVQAVNGSAYRVTDSSLAMLKPGDVISRGDRIRTARDSTAYVTLNDGSQVEMRERSEFFVSENSSGTTLNLARGNVIVEAAKQKDGRHLYVATSDSLTSVVGTVFSVNNGTKGTRVSVVEGEVHVNHAGVEDVLRPGDQTTTNASVERVPVKSEIAWSRNAEKYGQMVTSLSALSNEVSQKAPRAGVRYSTRFLNLLPEGTVLYAALPNLATTLSESNRIMQERIKQNPALREWWEKENASSSKERATTSQIMERVREFGEYLGEEIVVGAQMSGQGEPGDVLVLGDLKNSAGFRPFLEKQIAELKGVDKGAPQVRIIDDPMTATQSEQKSEGKAPTEILVWINQDFFAVAPRLEQLQQLAERMKAPQANAFTQSPFYARISEVYADGAGLVVAADLQKIIAQLVQKDANTPEGEKRVALYRQLGLLDLKHFVVEQKDRENRTYSQAALTFNEQRKGIASWLAQPGPMGSLEFISPEANIVAAFVVKEPVSLVDDLLGYLETASPGLQAKLKELESEHKLNLRNDIAAPLGGEYAFTIDGPVLPTPSWKMIVEVYDQAKLQQTLERVVEEVNKVAAKEGKNGLRIETETSGGQTFYTLKSVDFGLELHYAYVNGYMIAAASRALVDRAIRYRQSGQTLLQSARFRAGLPADGNTNFSAVFYHDLAPLLKPLANRVQNGNLPKEGQEALRAMAADGQPTLAYAYAQGDRITLASNTDGGPFGLSPASILGLPNSFALQHILMEGMGKNSGKQ
ncbi:MAG TPA: FecR domain-containing protein [Pyrinomonadaceae bacterium]